MRLLVPPATPSGLNDCSRRRRRKRSWATTARPSPCAHCWPCLNTASYFSSWHDFFLFSSWRRQQCLHLSSVICLPRLVQITLFHLTRRSCSGCRFPGFFRCTSTCAKYTTAAVFSSRHHISSPLNIASFCHFYANGTVSALLQRSSFFSLCFSLP